MKTLFNPFLFFLLLPLFFACASDEPEKEEPRELRVSVTTSEGDRLVTDSVDFEFEILDGNGGYLASASEYGGDPSANVSIDGAKVTVGLLVPDAEVTITDEKNQTVTVWISSTHKSLNIPSYGLLLDQGQTSSMKVEFGAGAPYTVERIRGNASEARIDENNQVEVTSLGLGDTYYKVRDKRGSVAQLVAQTSLEFKMNLEKNYLEIGAINNLSIYISMEWGENWEIVGSTGKITERLSVGPPVNVKPEEETYCEVLSIHTMDQGKGTDTISLKDEHGNLAIVKVRIK